jgi:hypothetical protein
MVLQLEWLQDSLTSMDSGTPTEDLLKIASIMEDAVGLLIKELSSTPSIGTYESEVEGRVLLWSLIRHLEAIYELMRRDIRLIPAAFTLARSCFEISTRIKWLLAPKNVFARESRYLAQLKEEAEYLKGISELASPNSTTANWLARSEQILKFHDEVSARLPRNTKLTRNVPKLRDMLKQLGIEERYLMYRVLSQTAHGMHAGGNFYRENLGISKVLKEPDQSNWHYLIFTTWVEFCECGDRILECANYKSDKSIFFELDLELRIIIQRLKGH